MAEPLAVTDPEIEEVEIDLLLQVLRERFGYDYSRYSRASLVRRIKSFTQNASRRHVSDLIPALLHETGFLDRLVNGLSVRVTEFFRDPEGLKGVVDAVLPWLGSFAFAKVWIAGCSTGEEVYSLAILLKEAELLHRVHIYATDINTESLAKAQAGVFPLQSLETAQDGYRKSGGRAELRDYYVEQYGRAKFHQHLSQHIIFSAHNLVHDTPFGECQLVMCRNVLIYFDRDLQERVVTLFAGSLGRRGFLSLGAKEGVDRLAVGRRFEVINRDARLFRLL